MTMALLPSYLHHAELQRAMHSQAPSRCSSAGTNHARSADTRREAGPMIRKTMRVAEIRTSVKLEPEFWVYLADLAKERGVRPSALVDQVAAATPDRTNLASTLRTFALQQARQRVQTLQHALDRLALAGSTEDLLRVLEACPLPCVVLDRERKI